jgi:alkylation response protein AidB-like acyl-CoA dehydrogenase
VEHEAVQKQVADLSKQFAAQRHERQMRRNLDSADFDLLARTGFPLAAVSVESGGMWSSLSESVREICEMLRALAGGDSSVALVSAMHPAVLSYWLTAPTELKDDARWSTQCSEVFEYVKQGCWFGTITSEPGSGGDISRSQAVAKKTGGDFDYLITGQKHFGSGSGAMSFMVTTAVAEGEDQPDWFYVDTRDVPWDGSQGVELIAEWDGHGMTATQSHAMAFERFPAKRFAWPGHLLDVAKNAGPFIGCLFTSVIVGIVDEAIDTARQQIGSKKLGAYEKVEWTRAEMEQWLIGQAMEGMYRAVESTDDPRREVLQGKTAIAELAETVLTRLCRIVGGATFSRRSPFGFWFEDVRALGFLRPPWGLAFQTLIDTGSAAD